MDRFDNDEITEENADYDTFVTALQEVAVTLQKHGIETEMIQVGAQPVAGCIGCGACFQSGKCFREDGVNEFVEKAKSADGFIFGSPVHYAAASGALTSFLDRAFYGKSAVFTENRK